MVLAWGRMRWLMDGEVDVFLTVYRMDIIPGLEAVSIVS